MGAMENDANRCNFLYSDDRRCRNLVQSPGIPFCYYHDRKAERDSRDVRANARAADAFFDWLSRHPLDTATNLQQALNLLIFLLVSNRISGRQAESLIRVLRLSLKTVADVHREFRIPELRNHQQEGERFLRQIRETLLPAIRGEAEPPLDPAPVPPPTVPDPAPPFRPEPFSSQPAAAPPPARHGGPAPAAASAGGSRLEVRSSRGKRNRSAPRPANHRRRKLPRRLGPASGLANGFDVIFNGTRTAPPSAAGVAKLARAVGRREKPG